MVRLSALLLGVGLMATKTAGLTSSPPSATIRFPSGAAASEQALERTQQKGRHHHHHLPAAAGPGQLNAPAAVGKRDGSFHGAEYGSAGGYNSAGGYSSAASYGPAGGASYTQPGYSSYADDSYGYTEATTYESGGGGFLDNIGKYGLIIIPILLGITLLFLFPSVINVSGTGRDNRALGGTEDLSDDVMRRVMSIYTSISEDPICVNRLFCEMGSTLGHTSFANRTLQYIDYFFPAESDNMLILKKAAEAKDPRCDMLNCAAWEKSEDLRQRPGGQRSDSTTERKKKKKQSASSGRQQRL